MFIPRIWCHTDKCDGKLPGISGNDDDDDNESLDYDKVDLG